MFDLDVTPSACIRRVYIAVSNNDIQVISIIRLLLGSDN